MRTIGLDVHKTFAQAAILEAGRPVRRRQIPLTPDGLARFVNELTRDDQVVLEATPNSWEIADQLRGRAGRVVVSHATRTRAIGKVKTDKTDAEQLARLLAADFLGPQVWIPDRSSRILRGRLSYRHFLIKQRTQLRNRIHAVLSRNLIQCPYNDLFGKAGLQWLRQQRLPADEEAVIDGAQRLLVSIRTEIETIDRQLANFALTDPKVQHLVTIPGVGSMTALAIRASTGDIRRFQHPNRLVSYLGLDPRVRQSGETPAWTGRISCRGQAYARTLLVEAALSTIRVPGPLRAFYVRIESRRGTRVALVAVARKLAVLMWHLLKWDRDYLWAPPSLTHNKRAAIQRCAEGPKAHPGRHVATPQERLALLQAEEAYRNLVGSRSRLPESAAVSRSPMPAPN